MARVYPGIKKETTISNFLKTGFNIYILRATSSLPVYPDTLGRFLPVTRYKPVEVI